MWVGLRSRLRRGRMRFSVYMLAATNQCAGGVEWTLHATTSLVNFACEG